MADWMPAALIAVHGFLWVIGYTLASIDYEQKLDEGRDIDRRVQAALDRQHG